MHLLAYIGEEEWANKTQRVGLKQAMTTKGLIPLVVMDFARDVLQDPGIIAQLQAQANQFGKTIRLARFEYVSDLMIIEPDIKP